MHGAKTVRHPRIGDIAVEWDAYTLPNAPGQLMIVFTPQPGHEDRVRLLTTITTGGSGELRASCRQGIESPSGSAATVTGAP